MNKINDMKSYSSKNRQKYVPDLVSVIMPCFNSSKYIGEAIESVQLQTLTNWELLIVDDYSTDNSYDLIMQYAENDTRIRLVKQTANGGVVKARNAALEIANGQYVAFLDSDDKWKKNKLERQLAFMKKYSYAFTFTAYEYLTNFTVKNTKTVQVPKYQSYEHGLKNSIIGCLTVIVDRKQTGEFYMPDLLHGEDHFTWLGLMKSGFYAYGLNECLAEYRITNNSLSGNKVKAIRNQWYNYRNVAKLPISSSIFYFSCYVINAILKRI